MGFLGRVLTRFHCSRLASLKTSLFTTKLLPIVRRNSRCQPTEGSTQKTHNFSSWMLILFTKEIMTVSESKRSLKRFTQELRHVRFWYIAMLPFTALRVHAVCCTVQKTLVCVCVCLLQNWLAYKCNMYRYNTFSSFLHVTAALLRSLWKMNVHHTRWIFADSTNHSTVRLHQEKNYRSSSLTTKPKHKNKLQREQKVAILAR